MSPSTDRTPKSRPYTWSFVSLVIAWLIGMAASVLAGQTERWESTADVLTWVGLASGVLAVAAILPGVVLEWMTPPKDTPGRITIGFSTAMVIRLVGTVALVPLCRYQMPAETEVVAMFVLAWYAYLTAVDVTVLARLLPNVDNDRDEICDLEGRVGGNRRPSVDQDMRFIAPLGLNRS